MRELLYFSWMCLKLFSLVVWGVSCVGMFLSGMIYDIPKLTFIGGIVIWGSIYVWELFLKDVLSWVDEKIMPSFLTARNRP